MTEQEFWACLNGERLTFQDWEQRERVQARVALALQDHASRFRAAGRRDVAGRLSWIESQVRAGGGRISKRVYGLERRRLELIAEELTHA